MFEIMRISVKLFFQISHARPEDFGVYYCIVQDGIGLTEQSRKATVKRIAIFFIHSYTYLQIKEGIQIILLFFLHENICCGYSLEVPH